MKQEFLNFDNLNLEKMSCKYLINAKAYFHFNIHSYDGTTDERAFFCFKMLNATSPRTRNQIKLVNGSTSISQSCLCTSCLKILHVKYVVMIRNMLFCYWSVYQLFIDAEIKGCPLVRIFYNGIYISHLR